MNQSLFLYINSFANKSQILDAFMIFGAKAMPYIFMLILVYLWFKDKKSEALYSGYSATLGILINFVIGVFYTHPRPFMDNLGVTLLKHKAENSFPSDHTTFVLSIAFMFLAFKSTRVLGVVTTVLAIWCAVGRVYSGVHYPFDILGSFAVAVISVTVIKLLSSYFERLNRVIIDIWNRVIKHIIK